MTQLTQKQLVLKEILQNGIVFADEVTLKRLGMNRASLASAIYVLRNMGFDIETRYKDDTRNSLSHYFLCQDTLKDYQVEYVENIKKITYSFPTIFDKPEVMSNVSVDELMEKHDISPFPLWTIISLVSAFIIAFGIFYAG